MKCKINKFERAFLLTLLRREKLDLEYVVDAGRVDTKAAFEKYESAVRDLKMIKKLIRRLQGIT